MDGDLDDLQRFASQRDEAAFGRLVRRHADFVYAACLRQTRDPSLADDAAQAVFILLARKAGSIRNAAALAGWLHNVARYASANAVRGEKRRRRHESSVAGATQTANSTPASDAAQREIEAKLDRALARLSERDREVIVMRYFQQKSHEEIAEAITSNGHAAKMRVLRALDKLRAALAREGVTTLPTALEASLLTAATRKAPEGFIDTATKAALGATASAGASIAAAVATTMFLREAARIGIVATLTIAAVAGAALAMQSQPSTKPLAAAAPATTRASNPAWRKDFDAAYRLDPGEAIRRVTPPYVPARAEFYREKITLRGVTFGKGNGVIGSPSTDGDPNNAPGNLFFEFDDATNCVERITRFNNVPWRVQTLLFALVGLNPEEYTAPLVLLDRMPQGDWVYRGSANAEEKLKGLQKVLQNTNAAFSFEKKTIQRDLIIVRGEFKPEEWPDRTIKLKVAEEGQTPGKPAGGDIGYFVREFTRMLRRPVIVDDWRGSERARIEWDMTAQKLSTLPKDKADQKVAALVKRMGEQMHVEMLLETRPIETYVLEPATK